MSDATFVPTSQCELCGGTVLTGECQTCGSQYVDGKRVHDKYDVMPEQPSISSLQAEVAKLTIERDALATSLRRLMAELETANRRLLYFDAQGNEL